MGFIRQATQSWPRIWPETIIEGSALLGYFVVSLLLLICSKPIAGRITRDLENTNIELRAENYEVLQAVAFSLLGAYVLTYALPDAARIAAVCLAPRDVVDPGSVDFPRPGWNRVPLEYFIKAAVQLALGIWLLFGSRSIVRTINRVWAKNIRAE